MTQAGIEPARLPPGGLPGLDPAWSRLVAATDHDGVRRTWHVLDTHALRADDVPDLTVLCVHGNPTWSYLWRRFLAQAPSGVRVIAPDHLDMGYSERTGTTRRLADRVADLTTVTEALGVTGPVVTVAHDWGGPISLGWALAHREALRGIVLLNTAVHQPAGSPAPTVIRMAGSRLALRANTVDTPLFVRATTAMSTPRLPRAVTAAFAAPYRGRERRRAIGDFVADIPLDEGHPSATTLDAIAEGIRALDEVPTLLLWGPGDPVFSDLYLNDLIVRLPHADVHRYEGARHLVSEDAPRLVDDAYAWIADLDTGGPAPHDAAAASAEPGPDGTPIWADLDRRARQSPDATCLAEPGSDGGWRYVPWHLMHRNVDALARGLSARGVHRGDRVGVLIPPGADLLAVVYACWRIGAIVVVTDAGLGVRGMRRALRGAAPRHLIGIPRAMALVRVLALPGRRISTAELPDVAAVGATWPLPEPPDDDDEAVIVFTSGSTGPAKGVVYRHRQVQRTRDLLRSHYGITDADALVAAFAPWSVLGPALGIGSALPDMDVTSPRTLKAGALSDAVGAIGGTLLWASPAAFASILATAPNLTPGQRAAFGSLRLVLGAGAPVSSALLHGMADLCPNAEVRTPYGMTEALPVCDVTIDEIDAAGPGDGVLVGLPLPGVEVRVSVLDDEGGAHGPLVDLPDATGEIAVRGAHLKDRYDRLWATERASSRDPGWHRTGDVGHLDGAGRLWIGGRLAHVVTTAVGPLTPVGVEQRVESLAAVRQAACVGVGPVGTQAVVVVVVTEGGRTGLADLDLVTAVRAVAAVPVAAVLERRDLPVDIRHNSKIDRAELARWAAGLLAGRQGG